MKLLVIDFDYFFPTNEDGSCPELGSPLLYDWGHNEGWAGLSILWVSRAATFKRNEMPLPGLSGLEKDFWKRFKIKPRATLFYADSNAWAGHIRVGRDVDEVWLYDAHHDSGYRGTYKQLIQDDQISCEDWMCFYHSVGAELHVRYPQWRKEAFNAEPKTLVPVDRQFDDMEPSPIVFDRVFVCRSGGWIPPWADDAFEEFVQAAPVNRRIKIQNYEKREFNPEMVDSEIAIWDELMKNSQEVGGGTESKG